MITLAEFLYLENIDEAQSKSLLSNSTLSSLTFESPTQFREFFIKSNILLKKQTTDKSLERRILLERLKSFKGSSEYSIAKKFISEQARLKKELIRIQSIPQNSITSSSIESILNGITSDPIDPFFSFIIRKILTGSDTGQLPSESLKEILEALLKQPIVDVYDEISDVIRDDQNRIIDFQNLYKNIGRLRVPLLDDRFIIKDFRYIVKTEFKSLSDAVMAENNVIAKLLDISNSNDPASDGFIHSLKELIIDDSNSLVGLNAKIKSLQDELEAKQATIDIRTLKEIEHEQYIDSIATDNLQKELQLEAKDKTIEELSSTLDTTVKNLESDIAKQLKEIPDAFDSLNAKLEEQNKLAEEQAKAAAASAAAQAAALEKALGTMADSLKQKSSDGSSGGTNNPASADIEAIVKLLDSIYAVTYSPSTDLDRYLSGGGSPDSIGGLGGNSGGSTSGTNYSAVYPAFKTIIDALNIIEPPLNDYVYAPPSKSNQTSPAKELKQLLSWNTVRKEQFKTSVYALRDKDVSSKIKATLQTIVTNKATSAATLREVISNILSEWAKDLGGARGVGASYVKDAAHELDPLFKWDSNAATSVTSALAMANLIRTKIPTGNSPEDANKLLHIMELLDGISTVVDKNGSWIQ